MIAIEARDATDDRTLGELFYTLKAELQDIKLSQSLIILINTLCHVLNQIPMLGEEIANEIMDIFLNTIPASLKRKLLLCA